MTSGRIEELAPEHAGRGANTSIVKGFIADGRKFVAAWPVSAVLEKILLE